MIYIIPQDMPDVEGEGSGGGCGAYEENDRSSSGANSPSAT